MRIGTLLATACLACASIAHADDAVSGRVTSDNEAHVYYLSETIYESDGTAYSDAGNASVRYDLDACHVDSESFTVHVIQTDKLGEATSYNTEIKEGDTLTLRDQNGDPSGFVEMNYFHSQTDDRECWANFVFREP